MPVARKKHQPVKAGVLSMLHLSCELSLRHEVPHHAELIKYHAVARAEKGLLQRNTHPALLGQHSKGMFHFIHRAFHRKGNSLGFHIVQFDHTIGKTDNHLL